MGCYQGKMILWNPGFLLLFETIEVKKSHVQYFSINWPFQKHFWKQPYKSICIKKLHCHFNITYNKQVLLAANG